MRPVTPIFALRGLQAAAALRFALRADLSPLRHDGLDGAWWPASRCLGEELPGLVSAWPADLPGLIRVLYAPDDWDDRPDRVRVGARSLRCAAFPGTAAGLLILTTADHARHVITRIPPNSSPASAAARIAGDA